MDTKSYLGITASKLAWSRLGITIDGDGTLSYESDRRFGALCGGDYNAIGVLLPGLIARALDELPENAGGDKVLLRVASLAARDRNIRALGKFGEKIPSNVNVWHHLPELRALLPEESLPEES